jgi:hypothetical protein
MNDNLLHHLRSRISATQTFADGGHPDADTLTAFGERKLSSSSRDMVAAHVSACPACREILSLSSSGIATESLGVRYPWRRVVAAAVLAIAFASSLSRTEDALVLRVLSTQVARDAAVTSYTSDGGPKLSYAAAELRVLAIQQGSYLWRVRRTGNSAVLEASSDGGRIWHAAEIKQPFEPRAVGFEGSDVWVTGTPGMLLSRDSGRHWLHLQSIRKR